MLDVHFVTFLPDIGIQYTSFMVAVKEFPNRFPNIIAIFFTTFGRESLELVEQGPWHKDRHADHVIIVLWHLYSPDV